MTSKELQLQLKDCESTFNIYYSIYGNKNGAAEKPKTFGQHRLFRCIAL